MAIYCGLWRMVWRYYDLVLVLTTARHYDLFQKTTRYFDLLPAKSDTVF